MINVDGVPPALRRTPAFRAQCSYMLRRLQDPDFVRYVCAHEAAHLIFFEMIGPITYRPLGAFLKADPNFNRFVGWFAAIQLLEFPPCLEHQWSKWLEMWADAEAAGGIVGRKLFPNEPCGDKGDQRNLAERCRKIEEHFEGHITIDAQDCWKNAQRRVEQRLTKSPKLLERILQRADKIRPEFGLRRIEKETVLEHFPIQTTSPVFVPSFRLIP